MSQQKQIENLKKLHHIVQRSLGSFIDGTLHAGHMRPSNAGLLTKLMGDMQTIEMLIALNEQADQHAATQAQTPADQSANGQALNGVSEADSGVRGPDAEGNPHPDEDGEVPTSD